MRSWVPIFLAIFAFSAQAESPVAAEPECLAGTQHALLEAEEEADLSQPWAWHSQLLTVLQNEVRPSAADGQITWMPEDGAWNVRFRLPLPHPIVGLPYSVYAFELRVEGDPGEPDFVYFVDYTKNCDAGYSIFPRGHLTLPPIPMLGDSAPQGVRKLKIKIWGQRI